MLVIRGLGCMDMLLRHDEELIRFWVAVALTQFSRSYLDINCQI